ncbi:PREDICTED: mitochondrial inner membrane protease subunit 1 [Prunus dulcis]|uniref:PREDICTED: mitochondrial inner membrane protease subunit 1 n=1 Tax=Prunus dulcis TaxID=3755 RepID=A0A5E4EU01_PRUDU|nr:PREDICTED: mitochondrial inner membrane protease subunit 1 [Prunus dulcis]
MRLLNYFGQWRSVAKEAKDLTVTVAKFMGLLHVTDAYLCSSTLVVTATIPFSPHSHPLSKISIFKRVVVLLSAACRVIKSPSLSIPSTVTGLRLLWCLRGMFGFRGITSIPPLIHEHMELYLMVLFKAKCFAGCGHLMALDHWIDEDKEDYNIKKILSWCIR